MPRTAFAAAVATLACLAVAVPASAKQITAARVCGASDCREITDHAVLVALPDTGAPTDPPSHPAGGWYRTTITIDGEGDGEGPHETFAVAAFPRAGYVRVQESAHNWSWMPMTGDSAGAYRTITRDLAPRPLSRLSGFEPGPGPAAVAPADVGGEFPWAWVVAAALSLGAAGALLLVRRRRPATGY
jgi:hypothetical protein